MVVCSPYAFTIMTKKKSPVEKVPKPGRQAQRLAAILEAAEQVFLEKGYERGSLDDVARKANASKATIYAHFGNKFGLFQAILAARSQEIRAPLQSGEIQNAPARDVLTAFGRGFLRTLLSPVPLKFYRLIISQGENVPELSESWFTNGPASMIAGLAAFLEHRTATGELDVPDSEAAAEFFLMSLRGTLQMRALIGLLQPPFDAAIDAKVSASVELILLACAPRPKGETP